MSARSYLELQNSKHRLSLLLFLSMNAVSALFTLLVPFQVTPAFTLPLIGIPLFCLAAMGYALRSPQKYIRKLNLFAMVLGLLWAAHIYVKHQYGPNDNHSFLLISLFSIFFISALSLTDNVMAFCLNAVPSALTILWLDDMQNTLRILFTILLPIVAFSLHHLMLKRSEIFTQNLVTRLYHERDKFSDLSMLDPLTGLYNRRGLEHKLNQLLAPTTGNHFVLLLDIDHFKAYNDRYGHSMGDQALLQVATAIRDTVHSRDIVVRYGGEEFLVLLINVSEEYAVSLAENVRHCVQELFIPHHSHPQEITRATLSAGIAMLDKMDIDAAICSADAALYRAKHSGRNNVQRASNPQASLS